MENQKTHNPNSTDEEEEEEEETLSLCDLPIKEEIQSEKNEEKSPQPNKPENDFDFDFGFGSSVGSVLPESEMCAADDVFFRGQILPLRHSVSSDNGFGSGSGSILHTRCISRSESMDRFHTGAHTSNSSSRSSSHNSSSSTGSSVPGKPRIRNRFHSHPSPSPQIRAPSYGNLGRNSQKSSIWRFLQVGVVRTPGIELQDLKIRGSKSSGSQNSTGNGESGSEKRRKPPLKLFSGCRCMVDTVDSRIAIVKKEERESMIGRREKKHAMSRRRMCEWLKELSIAGDPD